MKTDSYVTIRVCFVFPCLFGMEGQEPLVWLVGGGDAHCGLGIKHMAADMNCLDMLFRVVMSILPNHTFREQNEVHDSLAAREATFVKRRALVPCEDCRRFSVCCGLSNVHSRCCPRGEVRWHSNKTEISKLIGSDREIHRPCCSE